MLSQLLPARRWGVIQMFGVPLLFPAFIISFINFIMTSQSNTFRLQRLTKTIGVREHSHSQYEPKQTFKLAAINSISRGVKYNDLSYVSGRDLNKLRKEPETGEDILYDSAHVNLADVRKNYDSAHKEKNFRQLSISKLKEEKNKLWITQRQLLDNRDQGNKQVKNLTDNLQKTKLLFVQAEIQKKVLLNMRARLKADKIVYDQRKFDMQKQHKFLKKQKEVIVIDKNDIHQSDDRTSKIHKKFLNQLKAEQEEREAHLRNLESMIEEKQRVNQLNQFRARQMQQIAQRAMQDKDDNQKNWQKLYLANKLLSRLLRNKMDKQMNKFFIVQSAFKTIKISTGVSDAETLVQKFLNKQSAYGDLLGKIAENEKKILILKQENEELRKEFKELQSEKEVIESTKKQTQNVENELKTLSQVDHKQQKSFIFREKIRVWISRNNKKINNVLGRQHPAHVQRDLKSISTAFIEYIKNLGAQLDEAKDKKEGEERFNLENNLLKKVTRIKQDKEQDEQSEPGDNSDETDVISSQRMEILKTNDKFMKELRKKFEEKKKLAAEASSPKKKGESEKIPVKKPEQD